MKKLIFTLLIFSLFILYPFKGHSGRKGYLLPKFAFNFPLKGGGDMSLLYGGGVGYYIKTYATVETSYLRFDGTGNSPNGHIMEADTILSRGFGKMRLFYQFGSGMYKMTTAGFDFGWAGFIDTGLGFELNFIPSLNLRISAIYYSLFAHKDIFSTQTGILLNF